MRLMSFLGPTALVLALATPAAAQYDQHGATGSTRQAVTSADIQRLQDQVYDANNEVARMRSRDQASADRLETRLDEVRDEVIYLRVKLRKEGSVSRNDYDDVRSRIESVRNEARTNAPQGTWSNGSSSTGGSNGGWSTNGSNTNSNRNSNSNPNNNGGWSTDNGGSAGNNGSGNQSGNAYPAGTSGQTTSRRSIGCFGRLHRRH